MAVIRHRAASGSYVPTYLLYSSHYYKEISYREELERLATEDRSLEVFYTLPAVDRRKTNMCSNCAATRVNILKY
jgi:NAD(P)H-flavin reductase